MLLAMATGTGKTKTCIALIYRLLKAQRFRRVLFLVDRSALGEQAANAFKDTRMESLQTFADIFGIKELDDQAPDSDTAVHIATVQGMVQRVLYPSDGTRRRPSISTTASSSTSATAATCSTASCPTPSSASAASTTTSRSTAACSTTSTP
jgi:restriction endonuclease